jgi:hypothetical protein
MLKQVRFRGIVASTSSLYIYLAGTIQDTYV